MVESDQNQQTYLYNQNQPINTNPQACQNNSRSDPNSRSDQKQPANQNQSIDCMRRFPSQYNRLFIEIFMALLKKFSMELSWSPIWNYKT
ncbi:hypothetical protein M9Y10_022456 [Tritrichomonas musculus]|uniref:Uncharacterized protein n=1 Tax=Tritrichomonas musculus TaxID=1915356 RepID=A0ABR2KSB0_9EUKA